MDSGDNSVQYRHNVLCKQPISCPWINSQPYPSTLNKNKVYEADSSKSVPTIPVQIETSLADKGCPSLIHSSSQFFYFLRLMQLFPETHPATLHTVLTLCKNDFFCAVDKLLYAKRCKALYSRSHLMFKKCTTNRSHPYCCHQHQDQNGNNLVSRDVNEPCKDTSVTCNYGTEDKAKCKASAGKNCAVNQEDGKRNTSSERGTNHSNLEGEFKQDIVPTVSDGSEIVGGRVDPCDERKGLEPRIFYKELLD